jgi:chemotaxis family two-component system response regulator Rcp1
MTLITDPTKTTPLGVTNSRGSAVATAAKPIAILLVEDNPGDVRLTQEALRAGRVLNELTVVKDGVEALAFLRREGPHGNAARPDLILLDLNLPRMDGTQVLNQVKKDPSLAIIPVVILTSSKAEEDIVRSYNLHANSYITKPVELSRFMEVVRSIGEYWLNIVKLPNRDGT